MLHRAYHWTMGLASHRHARWVLAVIAFAESSFFPVPPDVLLIPMVLARRAFAFIFAGICTAASVVGGLAGYAIGYYLYEVAAQPLLQFYGYGAKFAQFQAYYNDYGLWIVLFAGITPFPFKVITIASGVTALNLPIFLASSLLARGLRFFLVAALLWRFGAPIQSFIERYLGLLTLAFFVVLIGGFLLVKWWAP